MTTVAATPGQLDANLPGPLNGPTTAEHTNSASPTAVPAGPPRDGALTPSSGDTRGALPTPSKGDYLFGGLRRGRCRKAPQRPTRRRPLQPTTAAAWSTAGLAFQPGPTRVHRHGPHLPGRPKELTTPGNPQPCPISSRPGRLTKGHPNQPPIVPIGPAVGRLQPSPARIHRRGPSPWSPCPAGRHALSLPAPP